SRRNDALPIAITGKSGHAGRGEIAMKNLILCSILALCACAASSRTVRGGDPRGTISGSELVPIAPADADGPASR
ncbi:MAG TPA: hypothetical protein VFP52_04030, partial [Myxococcales bacterium]|nr:hypothetical protein [Myxococcales bacterium]